MVRLVELRRVVHLETDPVTDAVNHPEHRLLALPWLCDAIGLPRRVERRRVAVNEAELRESLGAHHLGRILRRDARQAGLAVALGGRLRVAHDLIERALVGRELARHRHRARDVGGVSLILGRRVHDDQVALRDCPMIAHVVQLCPVGARANDRAVGWAGRTETCKRALHRRLDLVLPLRLGRRHDRPVSLAADLGGLSEQGELGRALPGANRRDDRARVSHVESRVTRREGAHG